MRRKMNKATRCCAFGLLLWVLTASLSGVAGLAWAGKIHLKNGDVITGDILKFAGGKLTVDTEHSGEIEVDVEHVSDLESAKVLTVEYEDGREVDGYLDIAPDGTLAVRERLEEEPAEAPADAAPATAEDTTTVVDLSAVESIHEPTPYLRYKGNLQFGLYAASGNSDQNNLNLSGLAAPSWGKNTIAIDGQLNRAKSDGDLTESNWRLNAQYEREFWKKWNAFVFNSYDHDSFQDLDLRTSAGAGLGYTFFEPAPTLLKVGLGPAYIKENYEGSDDDREFAALRWTLAFDQELFSPDVSIYHDHRLSIGLSKSQFIAQTVQGLRFSLIGNLSLLAEFQYDHNAEPPEDKKKDDYRYLVKLAYTFVGDETDWWQ